MTTPIDPVVRAPGRSHVLIVAMTFALSMGLLIVGGASAARADPADWPAGAWPDCTGPADQYCLEDASVTPVGGVLTPVGGLGLSTYLSTLPSGGGPASVNWAINGWDDVGVTDAVRAGDISFVVRVGQFVPRYTMAIAKDMHIATVTDGGGDTTITITGHAVQMNWTTGPLFGSCVGGSDCGDENTQADAVGTRLNFSGNTQDMSTWSPAEQASMGGMYIATNAQARPVTLLIGTYPDLYWYMGALGNPHLTQDGVPTRGSFNAWMPPGFFTSAGTTPGAAAAVGFDVSVGAPGGGPGGPGTSVPAIVSQQDGGVAFTVTDMPFSVHAVTVTNEPPTIAPGTTTPGVPQTLTLARGAAQLSPSWLAPTSDGGDTVTGYTARAFTAASGGSVAGSCTTSTTSCGITGLTPGTTYYVAVTASNSLGEGTPATRVSGAPADPPGAAGALTLTPGNARLTVTWSAPASDGGSAVTGYTASAYPTNIGGSASQTCTSTGTSCALTGLTNGTGYFVSVVATNAAGDGPATSRSAAIPAAASPNAPPAPVSVPSAPTSLTVVPGRGYLAVSWRAPATNGGSSITGYTARAHAGTSDGPVEGFCTSTAATTGCTIAGLTAATDYVVEVSAANIAGSSSPAVSPPATTPDVPGAPTAVLAEPATARLAVSWRAPRLNGGDEITGYRVEAFTSAGDGEPSATCTSAAPERNCVLKRLKNGTSYYLSVTAVNGLGKGPPSAPRVRAVPAGPPGPPRTVAARWSRKQVVVSWAPPASNNGSALTGYRVRLYDAPVTGRVLARCSAGPHDHGCRTKQLRRRQSVWIEVTAINQQGQSAPATHRSRLAAPTK